MADLISDIRANITFIEGEISELRRAAKKNFTDSERVLQIQLELRAHMTRLEDLRHNLAAAEEQSSSPLSVIPAM